MTGPHLSEHILVALRQIIRAVDLHSKKLVHDYGLTGPQLVVLKELAATHDISIGTLADRVSLSHATVTGIINRLERRGLVKRTRGDVDRRRMYVAITDAGRETAGKIPNMLQERFVAQFDRLQPWEQSAILSAFQRVAHMMEARDIEASPYLVTGLVTADVRETLEYLREKQEQEPPGSAERRKDDSGGDERRAS